MFTLNGREIDRSYASQLQTWVAGAESEFTPDEYRRARRATAYLGARVQGPSSLAPRITVFSIVNLVGVLLVLVILLSAGHGSMALAELREYGTPGEVFTGLALGTGAYPLTFLCFAALTVGWPKWIRVIAAVVGFPALLWLFITGMALINTSSSGMGGLAASLYVGLIVWFIVLFVRGGQK